MTRRWTVGWGVWGALAMGACVPPDVGFFPAGNAREVRVAAIVDTVRIQQLLPLDSTDGEGLGLGLVVLARARAEGRTAAVLAIESVLRAVPQDRLPRVADAKRAQAAMLARLRRQDLAMQFDLTRADAVEIRAVTADTIRRAIPPAADDPLADPVEEAWLVLVLTGEAVLDPAFGRREGAR